MDQALQEDQDHQGNHLDPENQTKHLNISIFDQKHGNCKVSQA